MEEPKLPESTVETPSVTTNEPQTTKTPRPRDEHGHFLKTGNPKKTPRTTTKDPASVDLSKHLDPDAEKQIKKIVKPSTKTGKRTVKRGQNKQTAPTYDEETQITITDGGNMDESGETGEKKITIKTYGIVIAIIAAGVAAIITAFAVKSRRAKRQQEEENYD